MQVIWSDHSLNRILNERNERFGKIRLFVIYEDEDEDGNEDEDEDDQEDDNLKECVCLVDVGVGRRWTQTRRFEDLFWTNFVLLQMIVIL
jgi:hypothetical protein